MGGVTKEDEQLGCERVAGSLVCSMSDVCNGCPEILNVIPSEVEESVLTLFLTSF